MVIIVVLLMLAFKQLPAAGAAPVEQICGTNGTYEPQSIYQANLQLLSTTLMNILSPSEASTPPALFAKSSVGAAPDTVYGLVLCRGDTTNGSACVVCVATAFRDARRLCGLNTEAHVLYEACMLRFSYQDFAYGDGRADEGFLVVQDPPSATDTNKMITQDDIDALLVETARQAAYHSTTRYATGRMDFSGSSDPELYSLVQCTPNLSPDQCSDCLQGITNLETQEFSQHQSVWAAGTWCNFRYATYKFYQGQPTIRLGSSATTTNTTMTNTMTTDTAAPPPGHKHKRLMTMILVTATVAPLLASLFGLICCIRMIRRRGKGKAASLEKHKINVREDDRLFWGLEGRNSEFKFFDFSQVSGATSNFSSENKLGQGGFGPVYKGKLPNGLEIAIKRLASCSGQGFMEFKNEVQLIAKLQHINLVRLLGCCSEGEEKILIYEYLPNRSLDFFIFDEARRALLSWDKRLTIIEGIAQGLLYLHEHSRLRVIHRDLKASNILLDCEMSPKISDFGLAKIFNSNDSEGNTKKIAGTFGYMAPEYASKGIFSIKSDVFSFGVLILEIVSGTRNSGFHQFGDFFNLLGYAWKLWKEERWLALIDASLVPEIHALEMMRCVNIALLCVQENAADRPTMSNVGAMLSSHNMTLPDPKHPAYFHVTITKEEESSTTSVPCSVNDVTISVLNGR